MCPAHLDLTTMGALWYRRWTKSENAMHVFRQPRYGPIFGSRTDMIQKNQTIKIAFISIVVTGRPFQSSMTSIRKQMWKSHNYALIWISTKKNQGKQSLALHSLWFESLPPPSSVTNLILSVLFHVSTSPGSSLGKLYDIYLNLY